MKIVKMKKRSNGSSMKKRKSFNRSQILKCRIKKSAHLAAASTPVASTSDETSTTSVETASTRLLFLPERLFFCSNFYTLATLTPLLQLAYSRPAPTCTPSASSIEGMELTQKPHHHHHVHRHLPLHHQQELRHLPLHQPLQLPLHQRVFNKQLDYGKVIIEIMKAHFVEAHLSFGKVPDRMKNMYYTKLEVSIDGTRCMSMPFGALGIDGPYYDTST
ncbi:hypothetical protein M9H77_08816 [Catharanthus roseus]|uniref:Uncharacterized protein n=1 Tax=Catharanthus roseus TaxID=4058 RepID=A0ACC0BYW0_CATRO|nr:hypothetical protein M9H77_08816 [Catharanthus roseus]